MNLEDLVNTSIQDSMTGDILVYNEETEQWENRPIESFLEGYIPTVTIETDNVSIENVEGILQLKDFGVGYYAYIPAIIDEETGEIISPSNYEYTEGFKSGLEPRIIVDENNNLSLAWYEPGAETVEDIAANLENISKNVDNLNEIINAENGLSDQVKSLQTQTNQISTDLEAVKSNKADANSVYTKDEIDESFENIYTKDEINTSLENIYTKEETNIEIGKAVAAADHLKRIIVKDKTEIINNYFDKDNYDTYIFMVPTGLEAESDKYDEYIIIEIVDEENISTKYLEKVGSWEINLEDYATLEYVDNELANKVTIKEGERLITDAEGIKLASIEEGAQKNYITSVDENQFTVNNGNLNIKSIDISAVNNLEEILNSTNGQLTTVNGKITNLETLLNSKFANHEDRIMNLEEQLTWAPLIDNQNI